jgi:hypothetical protein
MSSWVTKLTALNDTDRSDPISTSSIITS